MHRAELHNGIAVLYTKDSSGKVIIQYPDGHQVRTNWAQLSKIESLIDNLRQAYEVLLAKAGSEPDTPVETLLRIDDLLFEISSAGKPGSKHTVN